METEATEETDEAAEGEDALLPGEKGSRMMEWLDCEAEEVWEANEALLAAEEGGHSHAATESYRLWLTQEIGKPMSAKHWGGAPAMPGARRLYPQQYRLLAAEERLLPPEAVLLLLEPPPTAQASVLQVL